MLVDCQAIVLAGQKLGEADTLVTMLTVERGLVKGVAKGARRLKSRFSGAIQPFTYGQAILVERRAMGLRSLAHFDSIHSFQRLREDFEALSAAAAMVNAARRLVPDEQPSADAFALLLKALRALEAGRDLDRVVLWYLLALLQAAGYQPRVDRCLVGRHSARPSEAEGRWWFVPHLGGAVCPSCGVGAAAGATGQGAGLPMTPGVHALLRQALRMPSSVRHRVSAGAELIREARGLLEACVDERGRRLIKRPVPNQPVPRSVNAAPARRV